MDSEHTPLTDEELAAMRERAEAATPGPWTVAEHLAYPVVHRVPEHAGDWYSVAKVGTSPANRPGVEEKDWLNAAFIAAAREDVPRLLAEVERLRAENERLRDPRRALMDRLGVPEVLRGPLC